MYSRTSKLYKYTYIILTTRGTLQVTGNGTRESFDGVDVRIDVDARINSKV
jgi:hypothetical protein